MISRVIEGKPPESTTSTPSSPTTARVLPLATPVFVEMKA